MWNNPSSKINRALALLGVVAILSLASEAVEGAGSAREIKEAPSPRISEVPQATVVSPTPSSVLSSEEAELRSWCTQLRKAVSSLNWKLYPCRDLSWKVGGKSIQGRPLVYLEMGAPDATNTTLVFSMVHGDEVTPLFLGLQLAHWLRENQRELAKTRVVIAPLVNPDSFFRSPRTRMNARGVDVNRNFATHDWGSKALALWRKKFRSDPRRFPGSQPESEPETLFQLKLIRDFKPQKILSIHAPLNFLDYDGPSTLSLDKFPRTYVQECMKLRSRLKAISGGFFPGSLGNYAGHELGIPTLTLELPSADARKAERYWNQFSKGIRAMIEFSVPTFALRKASETSTPRM